MLALGPQLAATKSSFISKSCNLFRTVSRPAGPGSALRLLVLAGALYALGYQTTPHLDLLLAFLAQKRPHDLINETRRHEFPNADIGRRAAVAFAEIGAKHQIPNHHVLHGEDPTHRTQRSGARAGQQRIGWRA